LERDSGKPAGEGFGLGMNPEFLTEGEAVEDFMHPDRLVLGAIDSRSLQALEDLYEAFPGVPRIRVNCRTAEMIKYAGNCLLATLISFSNEIANLASALGGVDAMEVVQGIRSSRYLNVRTAEGESEPAPIADFLVPGCGYGGSCLPKDISALIAHGRAAHASMKVLEAVRDTNNAQPARILRLLEKRLPDLKDVPITVLGLAFRPGTSDLRESPAIPVIRDLLSRRARVSAFDPALVPALAGDGEAGNVRRLFEGQVGLCGSLEEAVAGARGIVLITRWPEFARLPALLAGSKGREAGEAPVFVDGRRMLDKNLFDAYEGIGL
jgi:UDPglucose 6-dehydrogenase/GDP-mannose 6-dehydrogenase